MILTDHAARRTLNGFGDPTIIGPVNEPDMTSIVPTINSGGSLVPYSVNFSTASASCPTGGDWNSWCDCTYPAAMDPVNSAKCKSTPLGSLLSFAPWTLAGRTIRGLSGVLNPGSSPGGGSTSQGPVVSAPSDGIFGLPKEIAIIGGAVAVIGLLGVAVAVKKSKRRAASAPRPTQAAAMAGYRQRKRR